MLKAFARFEESRGLRVLEVGLGTGTDFVQWLRNGAIATGRDLTDASVALVRERVALEGFEADVQRGDAEVLDLPSDHFDITCTRWGCYTTRQTRARRSPRPFACSSPGARCGSCSTTTRASARCSCGCCTARCGCARLVRVPPTRRHAESPGTQMFSAREATEGLRPLVDPASIRCQTFLGAGDLLTQKLSSRYPGRTWRLVQRLYPRWFIRHVIGNRFGTVLTVEARQAGGGAEREASHAMTRRILGLAFPSVLAACSETLDRPQADESNVIYAHSFAGATMGEKLTAAINALPATVAESDTPAGFTGAQRIDQTVVLGSSGKSVELRLGSVTLSASVVPFTLGDRAKLLGNGRTIITQDNGANLEWLIRGVGHRGL